MINGASLIDEQKMLAFAGKVIEDFGAALSAPLAYIGQELGLYKALAQFGPMSSAQLAERTGTAERYIREWLINQAAGGYVEYDPSTGHYGLNPEQTEALTNEQSPFFVGGGFYCIKAMGQALPRIMDSFRTGAGMKWAEHDADLFVGTERFFRPGYVAHLVKEWIPALSGIEAKLRRGGKVADIGCGHGASTIIMAKEYPKSRFYGFDSHEPSIERARRAAAEAGVADRVQFDAADASAFPGSGYDLIAFFDCYHDMGDPEGAARQARKALADGGSIMLVEPMAGKTIEGNFNPIGRTYSAASVLCCTPNAIACGGTGLGTVASDETLQYTFDQAGFSIFRRAAETPFNRIFEARP